MDHKVYHTIDKSTWMDGPWKDEPDKEQWVDPETGYPCLLKRHPWYGYLCGYVGVYEGHPWFKVHYDNLSTDDGEGVIVHGVEGLTYSDSCEDGPEDSRICHVPAEGEPDHVWWLGFHCHEDWDFAPHDTVQAIRSVTADDYRSVEYVKQECAKLARQAAEAALAS